MIAKKLIVYGFGILLLAMAVTQFMDFGYYERALRTYMTPVGDGVKLLGVFVSPFAFGLLLMEVAGVLGFLVLSKDNSYRYIFMKLGVAVFVVWVIFIASMMLRNLSFGEIAAFFGGRIRQNIGVFTLLQSLFFLVWGITAYRLADDIDEFGIKS